MSDILSEEKKDYLPMSSCGNKLCDGMCKRRMGIDVKNWERVFAVIHPSRRKNDRDEMYACILEQRCRAGFG